MKRFVLFNSEKNQYWTGSVWDVPYSLDIHHAKTFTQDELDELFSEERRAKFLGEDDIDNDKEFELINEAKLFEVKTIYSYE